VEEPAVGGEKSEAFFRRRMGVNGFTHRTIKLEIFTPFFLSVSMLTTPKIYGKMYLYMRIMKN
jgi:hypothetical protein